MKYALLLILAFALFAVSCKSNRVLIRFRNDSPEDFRKLNVRIFDSSFSFENLRSDHHTKYIKVREAYPYCSMEVITYRDTTKLQPAVFLDKQLYKSGKLIISISFKPFKYKRKRILNVSTKRQPV